MSLLRNDEGDADRSRLLSEVSHHQCVPRGLLFATSKEILDLNLPPKYSVADVGGSDVERMRRAAAEA